jgi:hypothetical protein
MPRNGTDTKHALDTLPSISYGKPMTNQTPTKPINHAFFMSVRTTTDWIAMTPKERFAFVDEVIRPILTTHPKVTMRFFDSEAFSAEVSDVLLWETTDVLAYQSLVEDLRETKFWGTYFEVVSIIASIENAYAHHYNVDPV